MAKTISEQLADVSVSAKNTEDAVAAALKEGREKLRVRKELARAAATLAVQKVNDEITSVGNSAASNWNTVKAKISGDMSALKANVAHVKHEHGVKRAESRADRLEWQAGLAIDYAIASIEQAKLAVLDAIDGRLDADEAKQAKSKAPPNNQTIKYGELT